MTQRASRHRRAKIRPSPSAKRIAAANTFAGIAEEYITKLEAEGKATVTIAKTRWLLTKLSPALGTRPIAEISPHELLGNSPPKADARFKLCYPADSPALRRPVRSDGFQE